MGRDWAAAGDDPVAPTGLREPRPQHRPARPTPGRALERPGARRPGPTGESARGPPRRRRDRSEPGARLKAPRVAGGSQDPPPRGLSRCTAGARECGGSRVAAGKCGDSTGAASDGDGRARAERRPLDALAPPGPDPGRTQAAGPRRAPSEATQQGPGDNSGLAAASRPRLAPGGAPPNSAVSLCSLHPSLRLPFVCPQGSCGMNGLSCFPTIRDPTSEFQTQERESREKENTDNPSRSRCGGSSASG
ncbi:uncharacterized protein LOC143651369 [Tamandua tetradactyla]|uniref:uncharacterized protein LOC143651369 n=1 Tax=Tamandua tetradactyla TaxID=48850 RepID=UPI004054177B